jgi:hypothetical protein
MVASKLPPPRQRFQVEKMRFSHLKRRHDRSSATPHAGDGDLTRLILLLRRALASYRPFS